MENPATWGPAEKIIDRILGEAILETAKPAGERRIGLSWARRITNALRSAGLLDMDTAKVTRFEVVNHSGRRISTSPESPRALVAYDISVSLSLQDDDRTLKVFLGDGS